MSTAFFASVRTSVFGGKLLQHQVEGIEKVLAYGSKYSFSNLHLAYILATIKHETAGWMQPIREGAWRRGSAYTDLQARNAVAQLYAKGIIRVNYAKPDNAGNSFYGRGLVQITHRENYQQFEDILGQPLVATPDLALDWDIALPVLFLGMARGLFRKGYALDMIQSTADFTAARQIVNGDMRKNGAAIAAIAMSFYIALETHDGP